MGEGARTPSPQEEKKHKSGKRPGRGWSIFSKVENAAIFLFFAILASMFQEHSVLQNIDMMYL